MQLPGRETITISLCNFCLSSPDLLFFPSKIGHEQRNSLIFLRFKATNTLQSSKSINLSFACNENSLKCGSYWRQVPWLHSTVPMLQFGGGCPSFPTYWARIHLQHGVIWIRKISFQIKFRAKENILNFKQWRYKAPSQTSCELYTRSHSVNSWPKGVAMCSTWQESCICVAKQIVDLQH